MPDGTIEEKHELFTPRITIHNMSFVFVSEDRHVIIPTIHMWEKHMNICHCIVHMNSYRWTSYSAIFIRITYQSSCSCFFVSPGFKFLFTVLMYMFKLSRQYQSAEIRRKRAGIEW